MQTTNQTTNRASLRGRGGPAAAASSEVNHDQARLRESIVSQCHELRTALTTLKVSSSHVRVQLDLLRRSINNKLL
jgi:hypothetical protein